MSEPIKHECGFVFLRLLKPLSYYKKKYKSEYYGLDYTRYMMEKLRHRGSDGAGFASIKLSTVPGDRYISRVRSTKKNSIDNVFQKIYKDIHLAKKIYPKVENDEDNQKRLIPHNGELFLGHVRYGTSGTNLIENVHPFLRQNNWMHRNLIVAGNFNMTNLNKQFKDLVKLGQHPKEKVDTVTIMEKIGHFLDKSVKELYQELKTERTNTNKKFRKDLASVLIADRLDVSKILEKSSKSWDGGYAIAGMLGHGDAFVLRDECGIRPAFYYHNDELVVVSSERSPIQSVFNVSYQDVKEVEPGHAVIVKKSGRVSLDSIKVSKKITPCSFERIYFSRTNDKDIYRERKELGRNLFPKLNAIIKDDFENTVFSFIPNTSEVAFLGLVNMAQRRLNELIREKLLEVKSPNSVLIDEQSRRIIRVEKVITKDLKERTFISDEKDRNLKVNRAYDIIYGSIVAGKDTLVLLDDSIVRGTTFKEGILALVDKLNPKRIIIVSSAPQIRYPDCYGIDMSKLGEFVAFDATKTLHREQGTYETIFKKTYNDCKLGKHLGKINYVKQIYDSFSTDQISNKIAEGMSKMVKAEVHVVFQSITNLHHSCPNHKGDWYFTGNYPTEGGNRIVNKTFINYYDKNNKRATDN